MAGCSKLLYSRTLQTKPDRVSRIIVTLEDAEADNDLLQKLSNYPEIRINPNFISTLPLEQNQRVLLPYQRV